MMTKKTIAEVTVKILEEQNTPLTIESILQLIKKDNLYIFKTGADASNILEITLKRKCINKNLASKNKENLFFVKDKKYGLLSWLTQEQKKYFIKQITEEEKSTNIKNNQNEKNLNNTNTVNNNDTQYNASGLEIISILSLIWVFFILMLFSYKEGSALGLNAMGDYLAGFFAPVLFLWLVYGVFLQKEEFGKVVDSFELQQTEFADSVKTMKNQVVQVEVQHLNTWFNRNIRTIDNIKSSLFKNINVLNIDSVGLINEQLKDDITNAKDYINIFDELKNILSIVLYIEEYLDILSEHKKGNIILIESASELKKEFYMLMGEDIKNIKEIMSIVFILIECRKSPKYKGYNIYKHWITNNTDILNLLVANRKATLEETLQTIMLITPKLGMQMNFTTGEINGNI